MIEKLNIVNRWDYSYYWSGLLCYVMDYVAFKEWRFCMRNKEWDGDCVFGQQK